MKFLDQFFDSLSITVVTANASNLKSEWKYENSCDPFSRLYYVTNGSAWIRHHDTEYQLVPGYVYFIPAQSLFSYNCHATVRILWCHFNATLWNGVDFFAWLPGKYQLRAQQPVCFEHNMLQIVRTLNSGHPGEFLMLKGLLLQALSLYVSGVDTIGLESRIGASNRFATLLEYIEKNLNAPLSVEALGDFAGMETSHFSTAFKEAFGIPPWEHVLRRRIKKVQLRLIYSDQDIAAIAYETGFCDAFHLSRTFKQRVGTSPSMWRREFKPDVP